MSKQKQFDIIKKIFVCHKGLTKVKFLTLQAKSVILIIFPVDSVKKSTYKLPINPPPLLTTDRYGNRSRNAKTGKHEGMNDEI
jgi:hypothetical protein